MGGGDLNLKKSWHPSTMKNMEKVWKAEQQDSREKKKIAELKKEIEMEKDREDIKKYAMEKGVIEKKDDKKLDWMYKGPNRSVDREDYLLGKPIDKSFEQLARMEKDGAVSQNAASKNHVEHECIPPSLRFFSGNEQVDLARKMQEDPLYAIKKKEMETRSQLLKNPVKLKQLQQLLEQQQQSKKTKSEKKKKKKNKKVKRHKEDIDSDDEAQLDLLLAAKYKKLKERISDRDLIESVKRVKNKLKQKKRSRKKNDDSSSESASDEGSEPDSSNEEVKGSKKKRHKKKESVSRIKKCDKRRKRSLLRSLGNQDGEEDEGEDRKREKRKTRSSASRESDYDGPIILEERKHGSHKRDGSNSGRDKDRRLTERSKDHLPLRNKEQDDSCRSINYNGRMTLNTEKRYGSGDLSNRSPHKRRETMNSGEVTKKYYGEERANRDDKWNPKGRKQALTEEEKERRRQEMIENATWRDREREQNVKRYREEEKQEIDSGAVYSQDFVRKQLVVAAEVGTVASRIKANINNIQRSGRAMDTNFAKR